MHNGSMKLLATSKRVQVIAALCEGCSINSIVRMTGVSKPTILKLLVDVGRAAVNFEDAQLRGLTCDRIEADEVWGFCGSKEKNVRPENKGKPGHGSVWTWVAIDPESKLIVSWLMGDRDSGHAHAFMHDLAGRLVSRPQLSTDALGVYEGAVRDAFGRSGVDYGQIHKVYARDVRDDQTKYSPAVCIACERKAIIGNVNPNHISTSIVERSNLTLRMSQRRWTRLTNAHSKKFENMEAAFALHTCIYNWTRKHASLKGGTPAMAMGLTDRVWSIADIVGLLEATEKAEIEAGALKRGPYKKRVK